MTRRPARIGLAPLALCLSLLAGCGGGDRAASGRPLKVALLPDESPATIIRKNQPLRDHLASALGRDVELVVTTDYSSMIEAMRRGQIDVGYFGPLSYVLLKRRMPGATAFAAKLEGGSPTYTAVLIAGADSGVKAPGDLRGKTVAFGDPASTSSHLIPKSMLAEAGLKAGEGYKEAFVGAHDAVAVAVQNGNAQGGGLSRHLFGSLVEQGTIKADRVAVIAESKRYPNYPWVLGPDLDPALREKIRTAFLNLKDPAILGPLKADGFGPVEDADYDVIRGLVTVLGIDPETLK
ncbi:Phosphate-import protein PhnD precursor [Aquisphaera giovannonii]|uniref:Phosphate-import protein PhnD n=1 Tax=Aquisphaera giovannonii TaxID=406548 RepID=A0A5B9W4Z1_9BACT|nr:phosphate/phosphite/phosphonate ABC transporter substrate-binding protein [Aquisphaera giovannonii]QEH35244.1 Phosphate-import protein PhnD precursor [Aquisphaera giovannonii]